MISFANLILLINFGLIILIFGISKVLLILILTIRFIDALITLKFPALLVVQGLIVYPGFVVFAQSFRKIIIFFDVHWGRNYFTLRLNLKCVRYYIEMRFWQRILIW